MNRGTARDTSTVVVGLSASIPPPSDLTAVGASPDEYVGWVVAVAVGLIDGGMQVAYAGDDRAGGVTERIRSALKERDGFLPVRQLSPKLALAELRRTTAADSAAWIAIGGARSSDGDGGVLEEIELAISRDIPVVICSHFGGAAAAALHRPSRSVNVVELQSGDPAEAIAMVRHLVAEVHP